MRNPVIGITSGKIRLPAKQDGSSDLRIGCRKPYLDGVERAGGVPMLLPCINDRDVIAAAIARIDGLLLSGGGDIAAEAFGEEPHSKNTAPDRLRDQMEFEAVHIAMAAGIPIFGICRGIQVLNVALGGALVQHLPDFDLDEVDHQPGGAEDALVHAIDIDQGSLLATILGVSDMQVNSRHHQAVQDVPSQLRINARAPDGIIEGLEAADGRPILAVQCHPEDCCKQHPLFQRLFDWHVQASGNLRTGSAPPLP